MQATSQTGYYLQDERRYQLFNNKIKKYERKNYFQH